MDTVTLDTAFVTDGIPHVAFWNGRVLTAEDLRAEQAAQQQGRNRLGRAIGAGVVRGLSVRLPQTSGGDVTTVEVGKGLAVDRLGQAIELPVDITLSLVVPPTTAHGDGVFTVCGPIASSNPTGSGVYLLVLRAASDTSSSVAGVPAFGNGVATECGPRYTVDGVSFRLVRVDSAPLAQAAGHDKTDLDALATLGSGAVAATVRNVLAHLFLDTVSWKTRLTDPFGASPASVVPGALATLLGGPVTDCEVPIALLTWASGGVQLVDLWSVRRPPTVVGELTAVQGLAARTREQLGRASYCQFQDELAQVLAGLSTGGAAAFKLVDRFRYLPAAGLVPMARGSRPGFSAQVLDGLVSRPPVPLDPVRVGPLLDESVHHAPVDTAAELLNVYEVLVPGASTKTVDHLVFSTSRIDLIEDDLRIDAVFPAGLLHLGETIEVRGRNFGFSTGDCRVSFDDKAADPRPGSTDSNLLLRVPLTLDVEPTGSVVQLSVTSNRGSDSVPVLVGHPEHEVRGRFNVHWISADPLRISAGDKVVLVYAVRSAFDGEADIDFEVIGDDAVVGASRILDENGDEVHGALRLEKGAELRVGIEIFEVPAVSSFIAGLRATVGTAIDDDIRRFATTGALSGVVPSAPEIRIETVDFEPDAGDVGSIVGSFISLDNQSIATVEAEVRFTAPGNYEVTLKPAARRGNEPYIAEISEPAGPGDRAFFNNVVVDATGVAVRPLKVGFKRNTPNPNIKPELFVVTVRRDAEHTTSKTYVAGPT